VIAMHQWNKRPAKLPFFDPLLAHNAKAVVNSPLANVAISCVAGNASHLIVGDLKGVIRFLTPEFTLAAKFVAYTGSVRALHYNAMHHCLVSVGQDAEAPTSSVRYWELGSHTNDANPVSICDISLNSSVPASALTCSSDMQCTVIGLCDGNICVLSGTAKKGKLRQTELTVQSGNPITGLVCFSPGDGEVLVATTSDAMISYKISSGNLFKEKDLEKLHGADPNLLSVSYDKRATVVRKEGVYQYSPQAKVSGVPWETEKRFGTSFHRYLLVVEGTEGNSRNTVWIFDMRDQYVAYNNQYRDITFVLSVWDKILIIQKDGSFFTLTEKGLQERLDFLNQNNLYPVAINLANDANLPHDAIAIIYQSYGDRLFEKGDYDQAMKVYIKTIGVKTIESSSIIKKFLENQHNTNLTIYLQALHEQGFANSHHTTLLFNCYIKAKDFDKIQDFIRRPELSFDTKAVL